MADTMILNKATASPSNVSKDISGFDLSLNFSITSGGGARIVYNYYSVKLTWLDDKDREVGTTWIKGTGSSPTQHEPIGNNLYAGTSSINLNPIYVPTSSVTLSNGVIAEKAKVSINLSVNGRSSPLSCSPIIVENLNYVGEFHTLNISDCTVARLKENPEVVSYSMKITRSPKWNIKTIPDEWMIYSDDKSRHYITGTWETNEGNTKTISGTFSNVLETSTYVFTFYLFNESTKEYIGKTIEISTGDVSLHIVESDKGGVGVGCYGEEGKFTVSYPSIFEDYVSAKLEYNIDGEVEIGKWGNDRLYQQCFSNTLAANKVTKDISTLEAKNIVEITGTFTKTSSGSVFPVMYYDNDGDVCNVWCGKSSTNTETGITTYVVRGKAKAAGSVNVIVKYTK